MRANSHAESAASMREQLLQWKTNTPDVLRLVAVAMGLYRPLRTGQIQLLRIRNYDEDSNEIDCGLERYVLAGAPVYIAVSYTWQDPIGNEIAHDQQLQIAGSRPVPSVRVNGTVVHLGSNLASALRRLLVSMPEQRMVWADQLCIAQDDAEEKGHQVAMMAAIFERAALVYMWLGRSTILTDTVFALLEELQAHKERVLSLGKESPAQEVVDAYVPAWLIWR